LVVVGATNGCEAVKKAAKSKANPLLLCNPCLLQQKPRGVGQPLALAPQAWGARGWPLLPAPPPPGVTTLVLRAKKPDPRTHLASYQEDRPAAASKGLSKGLALLSLGWPTSHPLVALFCRLNGVAGFSPHHHLHPKT
jgi:hypothetical protein